MCNILLVSVIILIMLLYCRHLLVYDSVDHFISNYPTITFKACAFNKVIIKEIKVYIAIAFV